MWKQTETWWTIWMVQSIPTLMIFQNGELKWRANGVQSLPVLKKQLKGLTA